MERGAIGVPNAIAIPMGVHEHDRGKEHGDETGCKVAFRLVDRDVIGAE
jgi:hypothetical protein